MMHASTECMYVNSNCLNFEPRSPERHKESERKEGKKRNWTQNQKTDPIYKSKQEEEGDSRPDYNTRKQNPTVMHFNGLKKALDCGAKL